MTSPSCWSCGADLAEGARFCRWCGSGVARPEGPKPEPSEPGEPGGVERSAPASVRSGSGAVIAIAVSSAVAVIAVVALAVTLSGRRSSASGDVSSAASDRSAASSTPTFFTPTTSTTTTTASTVPATQPSEQTRQEIQAVLLSYHQSVVRGDFQTAWSLLTERKRQQALAEAGYSGWMSAQASLGRYLDPSGLHVEIQSLDAVTSEARVMVTGMRWFKPNAPCTEWAGITWMKYEAGAWHYDPGYSTTPERRAAWSNRFGELLGGQCS